MIANGLSTPETAQELYISDTTSRRTSPTSSKSSTSVSPSKLSCSRTRPGSSRRTRGDHEAATRARLAESPRTRLRDPRPASQTMQPWSPADATSGIGLKNRRDPGAPDQRPDAEVDQGGKEPDQPAPQVRRNHEDVGAAA